MTDLRLDRKLKMSRVLVVSILLALITACNGEESLADSTEVWSGVVEDEKDGPIRAELSFKDNKYSLHYGVPRSCRLEGEQVTADARQIILRFKGATGGFCEKLYQGSLTIDVSDGQEWQALVQSKSIAFTERFSLQKKP